jgi:hypothetical protein
VINTAATRGVVEVEHHSPARNENAPKLTQEPIDLIRVEMFHDPVSEHRVRAAAPNHGGFGTRNLVNLIVVMTRQVLVDPFAHEAREVEKREVLGDTDEMTRQAA